MTETCPDLSVIITTYNARNIIGDCLDSLRRQRTSHRFEIVLVDSSDDDTAEILRARYPEVRLIHSPHRLYCGDARNLGMAEARAGLIAFLDADCHVGENWIEAVLNAHRSECLLVGGIIDNNPRDSIMSWAYYFCEFSLWLPARRSRRIKEIAGCCLSFKRSAYDRYGPFVEGTYCSDTAFQWRLQKDGHDVYSDPAIRVYHHSPSGLGFFLSHTYEHRKAFARVKCREKRLSAVRRIMEIALLPITPLLLMGATLLRLYRCREYLPRFVLTMPVLILGYCARCCGELAGYLTSSDTTTDE